MTRRNATTANNSDKDHKAGRKGGETVRNERGREFYEVIGRKGGQKVKQLNEEGKRAARAAMGKEEKSHEEAAREEWAIPADG